MSKDKEVIDGEWIDSLVASTGSMVNLETIDGASRTGMLTGLRTQQIKWNGQKVLLPTELELNGDPNDLIQISRLDWIEVEPGSARKTNGR
jgi:hypothetical protein